MESGRGAQDEDRLYSVHASYPCLDISCSTDNLFRSAGIPCDPSNPQCRRGMSEEWRVNKPFANLQKFGAWRERRASHFFIMEFAHLNELAGLFWSRFWHDSVPRAVLHSEALSYLSSAIGMLRQGRMTRTAGLKPLDSSVAMSGALELCNRAINLIAFPSNGAMDPEISLIACIMLAHFENEQSNGIDALSHISRSPQLLASLDEAHKLGHTHGLLDMEDARRVVEGRLR